MEDDVSVEARFSTILLSTVQKQHLTAHRHAEMGESTNTDSARQGRSYPRIRGRVIDPGHLRGL